VTRIKKP